MRKKKKERIMPLIVATTFATQPVYNAARAAHALRLDQQSALLKAVKTIGLSEVRTLPVVDRLRG